MLRSSRIRFLCRLLSTSMAWAMMPALVWGGVPTVTCACVSCHCASDCEVLGGTIRCSAGEVCCPKLGCSCCGCEGGSCASGCCHCCADKPAVREVPIPVPLAGKNAVCKSSSGCRASLTAQVAVKAPLVRSQDHQPAALGVFEPKAALPPVYAVEGAGQFNTGPPDDLVVTLRRLVI
jgi:hypothetical protein